MALYRDILRVKYPGALWRIDENDYATLVWDAANTVAKPTQAELDGYSAEVDTTLATEDVDRRRDEKLRQEVAAIFKAIDILSDGVTALYQAMPASQRQSVPATVVNRMQALRQKLDQIKADVT